MGAWFGLKRQQPLAEQALAAGFEAVSSAPLPVDEPIAEATHEPAPLPASLPLLSKRVIREINEGTPTEVAERHADLLLKWLVQSWPSGQRLPYETTHLEYVDMCHVYGISERPWNPVAKHLAKLTRRKGRPRKLYDCWIDHHGRKKRRRVYEMPLGPAVPHSAVPSEIKRGIS